VRSPTRLTPQQQHAIEQDASRLLLVASAGSGKTEVLTQRVIRHLRESIGDTFRLLAVTFTVRAAQELQSRLKATVSSEVWRVDAQTIHGFALDWLMRFGQSVHVYPDTIVYSEDTDRLGILAGYVRSLGEFSEVETDDLREVLRAIDESRLIMANGEHSKNGGPSVGSLSFGDLYEGYVAALDAANGIDFSGMLSKFLTASDIDPSFLGNFRSTYRYVLVDEGQDLTVPQAAVLKRLASPPVDLFVVTIVRQSRVSRAEASPTSSISWAGQLLNRRCNCLTTFGVRPRFFPQLSVSLPTSPISQQKHLQERMRRPVRFDSRLQRLQSRKRTRSPVGWTGS